jgi:hypothetical protein
MGHQWTPSLEPKEDPEAAIENEDNEVYNEEVHNCWLL